MDRHRNFAKNLDEIRCMKQLTVSEFAKELGIPKSTLRSILKDGQTTLNTALRISEALNTPLDSLTQDNFDKINLANNLLHSLQWYESQDDTYKGRVAFHINKILELCTS